MSAKTAMRFSLYTSATAAAQSTTPSWVPLVVYIGLAIGAVIVGTVAVMLVRRKFSQSQQGGDATAGAGLMEQLRQLHREGKISDEELTAIRGKMRDSLRQQVGMPGPGGLGQAGQGLAGHGAAGAAKGPDPAVLAAKRAALEEQIRQQSGKIREAEKFGKGLAGPGGTRGAGASGSGGPKSMPPSKPTRPDIR